MYTKQEREEWETLRDALADRFDMAFLEDSSLDTLQSLYDEMEAEDKLAEFLPEELKVFREKTIRNQEQLLNSIQQCRDTYAIEAKTGGRTHTAAFYESLDRLLEEFWSKTASTTLPEPLPDWWYYSFEITASGIKLMLNHVEWSYCNGFDCWRDQRFTLIEVPAKLLTVSEFAQLHGTQVVTVRQWIRRGKIRSAVKVGKEWRIPELAEMRKERGYVSCRYNWSLELTDLPEKYAWLNQFESALFEQDEEEKTQFRITLDPRRDSGSDQFFKEELTAKRIALLEKEAAVRVDEDGSVLLSSQEREELELYMISNSLIQCGPKHGESFFNYQIEEIGADYCSYLVMVF